MISFYKISLSLLLLCTQIIAAPQHGIAMHNDLKYGKDFKHFEGVNPEAPKGGTLKLGQVGKFDTTNAYVTKGMAPLGLALTNERLVFEGLMKRSPDEPFSLYGWIAESVEVAPDRSWITFHLNPKAKWADGKSITPEDVIFTHEILKTKGRPNMRLYYKRVAKVEKLDATSVKFTFMPIEGKKDYDPELPLLIGLMSVLPKHYFQDRDFEKASFDKVLGSGPYKIVDIQPGKKISYERRKDYWGYDLPVSRGYYNFDRIEVEYYREPNVERMAFGGGASDLKGEGSPAEWFEHYDFKAVKDGRIIKYEHTHSNPVGMNSFCFNARREPFNDVRVRRAMAMVFDFDWLNKNLFHSAFERTQSYYENTELASKDLPKGNELEILEAHKKDLPAELFTTAYTVPGHGEKDRRAVYRQAQKLLQEAGWEVKQGKLINSKTGKKFECEVLLFNKDDERIALQYGRNLKPLGIDLTIRFVDSAQFESRRLKFDFDLMKQHWFNSNSPGNEQYFYWGASMAKEPGSRNYPGVESKAVDDLCHRVARAKTRQELVDSVHALDRVLLWGDYVVPLYYNNKDYVAYWNKIGFVKPSPKAGLSLTALWSKEAEARGKNK